MARVTIEDCLEVVDNRFELSVLSGYRAKEISKGSKIKVDKDNDKYTVIALREIAGHHQDIKSLRSAYIRSLQKNAQAEDVLEENAAIDDETASSQDFPGEKNNTSRSMIDEGIEEEFVSVENYSFDDELESELEPEVEIEEDKEE